LSADVIEARKKAQSKPGFSLSTYKPAGRMWRRAAGYLLHGCKSSALIECIGFQSVARLHRGVIWPVLVSGFRLS